jgi:hypothetical protein
MGCCPHSSPQSVRISGSWCFHDRECVKETAPSVARSTGNRFCEVKDALKAAVETPLAQALGLPADSTAGTFKVRMAGAYHSSH